MEGDDERDAEGPPEGVLEDEEEGLLVANNY